MSVKKKLSILRNVLIFTAIAWFLVTFLIVPVLSTVKTTFFTDGAFSMQSVQKLLSSERVKRSLSNTYKMAFWSFVTVTINGVFQVLVTEYFDIKGSKLLELAFMTPLLYGGISLVTGYTNAGAAALFLSEEVNRICKLTGFPPLWVCGVRNWGCRICVF